MEALTLVLIVVLIWRGIVWRKRYATLIRAIADLRSSVTAARERVAELERRLAVPEIATQQGDLGKAPRPASEITTAAEIPASQRELALQEAPSLVAKRAKTLAEPKPFKVLKPEPEALAPELSGTAPSLQPAPPLASPPIEVFGHPNADVLSAFPKPAAAEPAPPPAAAIREAESITRVPVRQPPDLSPPTAGARVAAPDRAETAAELEPFVVLKLEQEAPSMAPGEVAEHPVEAPGLSPRLAEKSTDTAPLLVPPAAPNVPVSAKPVIEVSRRAAEFPLPPVQPTPAQPAQTRAEAIRERVARLRQRAAAAASVSATEPQTRVVRSQEISAAGGPPARAGRAWQWPAVFTRKTGETPDWEALIGGSWLNVIGIVVFVLGMALLAQHSLRQFGPIGKIATGLITGFALIGCGVWLERLQRYRLLAWTLVGGGWALLYFTAYAAYNIEASRIINEPAIGLLALSIVAAGIIVHSLRYRSELVTGLAYGLGFLAVTVTPLNAYTLVASALLAASQIAILRFFTWHYLALIAVAGTYLNHARWLGEIAGSRPDFWLSQGILAFYWVLFIVMALVRRPRTGQERLINLTVNVANTIGLLGLSAWQIWVLHGENLHYLTASATLAYVVAAGVSRSSGRPDLLRFNGSVAVLLFALTLPLALGPLDISQHWLAIYWLGGGVLAVACGYLARELLLRLEGYGVCGLGCLAVLSINLEAALPFDWRLPNWWIVPSVVLILLGLSGFLQRVATREWMRSGADQLGQAYGYAATAILATFLWRVCDPYLLGPSWLAAGLVFFEAGAGGSRPLLRNQAYLLLGLAFAALLAINLSGVDPAGVGATGPAFLPRPVFVGFSAAAYYYLYWRLRRGHCGFAPAAFEQHLGNLFSVAGSMLVAALAWKELDPTLVALAWITAGLVLFEVGAQWPRLLLRSESYVLFGLAFAALLAINLYEIHPASAGVAGAGLLPRPAIVGISAAVYYCFFGRLGREHSGFNKTVVDSSLANLFSIAGTTVLAIVVWKELDASLVPLAWILGGLALFEVGAAWPRPVLRSEAYVLFALAVAALLGINLYGVYPASVGLPGAGLLPRPLLVGLSSAAYYYLFWRVRRDPCGFEKTDLEPVLADLSSIAGTTVLAVLAWKELDSSLVALTWIFLGLTLFEVGAGWPRPLLRNQAYVLLGLAFAALLGINLYALYSSSIGLAGAGLLPRAVTVGFSAAAYYYVFWRLRREYCGFAETTLEPRLADLSSIAGTTVLAVLAWKELDSSLVALAWIFLGLTLFEVGAGWPRPLLRNQAYVLFGLVFAALLGINLYGFYSSPIGLLGMGLLPRAVAVGLSATAFYYLYWRLRGDRYGFVHTAIEPVLGDLFSIVGGTLLAILAWKELDPAIVALTWIAVGLVLFEAGARWPRPLLRNEAYVLFWLAFASLLAINLFDAYPTSVGLLGAGLLPRPVIVGLSAAAYYTVFWRLRRERCGFAQTEFEPSVADLFSIAASALVAILAWKELDPTVAPLAWTVSGLVLFEVGARWPRPLLRNQGYALLALAFVALLAIDLYELYPPVDSIYPLPRWLVVGPSAIALYWIFWRLHPERCRFTSSEVDLTLADYASMAGTVLLTVLAWKELDSVTVALAWGLIALGLFEIGSATRRSRLTQQAHGLAALTFIRLFMANFVALGQWMGFSHRLLSVLPIIAFLYYLYVETRGAPRYALFRREFDLSRIYCWGAGFALLALARFELGRAYAVVGMAPLFVAFTIIGRRFNIVDFRGQAYLLAALTFARCWATNAYLLGTVFGMPERVVTMSPAIVAFALATAICMRPTGVTYNPRGNILRRLISFLDANPDDFFALLGAALTTILFYYELPIGWVTLAVAIEGLILILSGIATEHRSFRIYGLTLLLIALLKLVVIDVSGVEPIYRILSYIGLGLILLMASLLYTRYRSVVEKYV